MVPPSDLSLAHLWTLSEVARHGSFSRAAATLHLSQPAVSLHVRQLEERLGLPLLDRVGKRAFPTRAGEALLAHAARAFAEIEAARQSIERMRGVVSGRVRLGTGATASIYLLPPVLRRLRARYPELELVVVTGNAPEMAAAVTRNELDLAIVTLPVRARELTVSLLFTDPLVAIAPAERAWRRRAPLTPAELGRHPLILYERGGTIRRVIDDWFRRAGVSPRIAMELGNAEAIKKLVSAGLGLSVSSAISIREEVAGGQLRAIRLDPPLARRLGLLRRRDKPPSPALEVIVAALEDRKGSLARAGLRAVSRWGKVEP
jgi:DNA-binding transcriptional LysR family regulator